MQEKVFLEISQNLQENTRARVSFLVMFQASGLQLIKKETLAQVFEYHGTSEYQKFLGTEW